MLMAKSFKNTAHANIDLVQKINIIERCFGSFLTRKIMDINNEKILQNWLYAVDWHATMIAACSSE